MAKKIGRNDPCPCGSGKKYKKCCIDKKIEKENNYLTQIKKEFPDIRAYSESKDIIWEEKARQLLNKGKYEDAKELYKKLCLAQPDHHDAFIGLANVYYNAGEKKKATWFMEEALKRAQKFFKKGHLDKIIIDEIEKISEALKNDEKIPDSFLF
jgi:tetratricopeptide (TPR) repeat protein